MSSGPLKAAIVGAGPAGLFTLDALLRRAPSIHVDVFERLPTPYGLIRSGVAPDHQGTKAVVRQFERAFARPGVHLYGNVEVGRDITAQAIVDHYDLVFVTTGAAKDRRLSIPGEDLPGVYGSLAMTGWLNGHPDQRELAPCLGQHLVVVGAGNVAIDLARLFAKTPEELSASDLCEHARGPMRTVRRITIVARGALGAARFDASELQALGRLSDARLVLSADDVPVLNALPPESPLRLAFEAADARPDAAVQIELAFELRPVGILGGSTVRGVRLVDRHGHERAIACDTVVTAIGAEPAADEWPASAYRVGWASGQRGAIPDTRKQAVHCVDQALATPPASRIGPAPTSLLAARSNDWAGWKRIDAAEVERARPPRPREKLTSWPELLAAVYI